MAVSFEDAIQPEMDILQMCARLDEVRAEHDMAAASERFDYEDFYKCVDKAVANIEMRTGNQLPGYLLKGLYYGRLMKWMRRFPSRIHVIIYDEFRSNPVAVLTEVSYFLGLPFFNFEPLRQEIEHEYQQGSRYAKYNHAIVREVAKEFLPHNELLGVLLGRPVPWQQKLVDSNYIIPV
jgi:hypothetical protein